MDCLLTGGVDDSVHVGSSSLCLYEVKMEINTCSMQSEEDKTLGTCVKRLSLGETGAH